MQLRPNFNGLNYNYTGTPPAPVAPTPVTPGVSPTAITGPATNPLNPPVAAPQIGGPLPPATPLPPTVQQPPAVQPPQQTNGGWYGAINSAINDWKNQGMTYNDQQANRLAAQHRVQGDDINKAFSQAANARAGTGVMGGTESQNLIGNLMGNLRQDVQNRRTGYYENAWGQNANLMNQAAQANLGAMTTAQQGNTNAQQNAMNLIAQAVMSAPGAAGMNLSALANLLGLGQQSTSTSTSTGTSESGDPTKKYELIANLM